MGQTKFITADSHQPSTLLKLKFQTVFVTAFLNLIRQYNQGTILPIAENLSVYIVSSFEIRQYSCTPRLHKRKNFLAMGQRFCKKTALFCGAAPDRAILLYCERRATMPITAPFLQKSIVPWLYCLTTVKYAFQPERIMALFWNLR